MISTFNRTFADKLLEIVWGVAIFNIKLLSGKGRTCPLKSRDFAFLQGTEYLWEKMFGFLLTCTSAAVPSVQVLLQVRIIYLVSYNAMYL